MRNEITMKKKLIIIVLLLHEFSYCTIRSFQIVTQTLFLRKPFPYSPHYSYLSSSLSSWKAEIDYSAANEYIFAHYRNKVPTIPYFYNNVHVVKKGRERKVVTSNKVIGKIYNARNGIFYTENNRKEDESYLHPASLHRNGFVLYNSTTNVTDFKNVTMIEDVYTKELYHLLQQEFEHENYGLHYKNDNQHVIKNNKNKNRKSFLLHVTFWNPMVRGEEYNITRLTSNTTTPTASVANMVHIDTDVGAYATIQDLVNLIENNRLCISNHKNDSENYNSSFPKEYIIKLLEDGHRFAIINFWRNIHSESISQSPLGILYTKYNNNSKTTTAFPDKNNQYGTFPSSIPDFELSKWYFYPNMSKDECLLFYQYDRLASQTSDLWHCALNIVNGDEKESTTKPKPQNPRASFDIRAFVIFDEIVSPELDRFHENRLRQDLTLEESGCFCEEQAAKQKNNMS